MSALEVTCPGCGVARPLEVVREALAVTRGPVVACWMVPLHRIPAGVARVAIAAWALERKGAAVLPPDLKSHGCGLVWCTVVDGRRVWAAEAEDLADLVGA